LEELYRCETPGRPLGQGVIGAGIEASLDVLEALWQQLDGREKASINAMLDALRFLHAKANTIGFVVETPEDIEALVQAMGPGTLIEQRNAARAIIRHSCFHAVVCLGRSMAEVASAAAVAIEEHGAQWLIMPGRAEALGPNLPHAARGPRFVGAGPGDLVIATSVAPFRIQIKLRDALSIAEPPLVDDSGMIIPADPELCRLAHEAADGMLDDIGVFFEGMTVTCDGDGTNAEISAAFPGALATDNMAYAMGLICLSRSVPCLIIQGLAETAQSTAASPPRRAACRLAVKVAEMLCRRW
jgi:nucleoside phosphorylase